MEVTLKAAHLRALAHLAAKADIRPFINGVWIEADRNTLLMGTSGAVLGVIDTGVEASERFDLMVPHHILEGLKKVKEDITFSSPDGKTWTASAFGTTRLWVREEYALLEWRRVVPKETSGIAQQFDVELIALFVKAKKELGLKAKLTGVLIAHNGGPGDLAARVQLTGMPEFVGVLMPIRAKVVELAGLPAVAPGWATGRTANPAPLVEETADDLV